MKRLILIDGNSLMFRSYYATAYTGNLMKTSTGIYTNALFGFCNMLQKLLEDNIEYAFVAFDAGKQTFRHQQYPEYKGKRAKLPDELRVQIPLIKQYIDIIKVKRLESLDFEGDDLLASVATLEYNDFDEIKIITGDKDLLQLVRGKIKVCLTKKGVGELDEYTENNFVEKMGFSPLQLLDYKGLVGDSSDNLPGIKGIGEKTAIKLINQYDNIEGIYDHIDELKGKTQELFISGKESAYMCKRLATLKKDISLNINDEEYKIGKIDYNELTNFFKTMEFTSFLKKIEKVSMNNKTDNNCEYQEITPNDDLNTILSFDSFIIPEIFGNNYYKGQFLGFSLVNEKGNFFFTKDVILKNPTVKKYLENENYKKKTFDYKSLLVVLKELSINIKNVDYDLLIAAYLINPSFANDDFKKVLDNIEANDLVYYDNIYGSNTKMSIPEKSIYMKYSVNKCLALRKTYLNIMNKIKENELDYLLQVEMDLSKVLGEMEISGLKVDLNHLEKIGQDLSIKAEQVSKEIFAIAKEEFNLNSPKQMGEILFDKLNLPHGKKNKTGYSTNVDVLEKLAKDYEIARKILLYRGYIKLVNTYVNGIKDVTDKNGFIHPLYKQALTNTGRLSSIEPNIQNMPIRTETGQVIREIFISRFDEGMIVSADYSQIELRVLSHMSNDEKMIESFKNGIDFHAQTASEIYEIPLENVTKEQRRTAKAINFGIIYGMSAWGLSETINVSPLEANIYINKYFYTYNEAKECLDKFIKDAKTNGYSQTLYNRRRYITELQSDNANLRNFGERTAMNSPIQGTAADIIKIAMNSVFRKIKEEKLQSLIIAQVHDELVFDCPKNEVDMIERIVKETMESAVKLRVPLKVEVNKGTNWFLAK